MLDQITDGQLWQQSQKGSAAPTKGYGSSLQSPAASVTHSHCPNGFDGTANPQTAHSHHQPWHWDKSCLDSMKA